MANTQKTLNYSHIRGVGDVQIYRIVLSGGDTSFTLSTQWADVYSIAFTSLAAAATKDVYFDGTDIKGAGFTANDTVTIEVHGKF